MDIGAPELLIVLVISLLLFGVGRLAKLGGELGQGIRAFRKGLQGEDEVGFTAMTKSPENNPEIPDKNSGSTNT